MVLMIALVGEVEPHAMLELLTAPSNAKTRTGESRTKDVSVDFRDQELRGWGVGPNVAHLVTSMYGGHVLVAQGALDKLAHYKEKFAIIEGMPGETSGLASLCVRHGTGASGLD